MNPEDAEEYTQALGQVMAGSWRQIALGRRLGVPDALGLSVQQWVDDRLGGYVKLSLQERREAVKELKDEGLSNRQAAAVLGVAEATVRADQQPARNRAAGPEPEPETAEVPARNRAAGPEPEDKYAAVATCADCGRPTEALWVDAEDEFSGRVLCEDCAAAEDGAVSEPGALVPPERRETKSHAVAHDERMEASRQRQEDSLALPDFADLGLDRIEYGTDALAYLMGRSDGEARVCITSPPYWAKRTYVPGDPLEVGQETAPEEYVSTLCEILNEVGRVLAADGCLFLNIGDTLASQPGQYRGDPARRRGISDQAIRANGTATADRELDVAEKSYCLIPERIIMRLVLQDGWRLAGKIVWHKIGHQPENVYDRLTQAWEPVYVLTRSRHAFFERDVGRDDVWGIPVGRNGEAAGHLAPFPGALVERAIKHASEPGDVVLDPFAGSGTVLHVAREMGRRFIGCDLSPQEAAG